MASKIEYCEETLEVTGGCTKCSPGCQNCWAIKEVWRMAHNPNLGKKWQGLVYKKNGVLNWTGKIKCFEDALQIPLKRKKPTTYFVDSRADLFHPKVPFEFVDKVMFTIYRSYKLGHTFLILTKRPDRKLEYFKGSVDARILRLFRRTVPGIASGHRLTSSITDLRRVHFGVSISTPDEMWKVTELSRIPAAVRWISFEPLLGGVGAIPLEGIHWVVVGGESGPGARPMHPDWPRNIRDQCVAAGVPFYFKQWGEWGVYGPNQHFDVLHWRTKNRTDAYKKLYKTDCCHSGCTDGSMPTSGSVELVKRNIKVKIVTLKGEVIDEDFPYGAVEMGRIPKKKAGCLLDGKEWKQLPKGGDAL